MRLAVTGHRDLPVSTQRLVDDAIRAELGQHPAAELVGLTCLADGADTLFARAVVDAGGDLEVVVPATGYRDQLPAEHHPAYDELLARAEQVLRLEHVEPGDAAQADAARVLLDRADALLAVWDGGSADGDSEPGRVVELARSRDLPVVTIWPDGASRG